MNTIVFSHKAAVLEEASQSEVYRSIQHELEALTPEELLPVNLDIPSAVAIALGALPRMRIRL
jgi:hypothetical protein